MASLRGMWEQFDNRWNQWVLNYSRGRQFNLLQQIGFDTPSWSDLAYILIGLLSTASLAGAGWALYDRQRQDPWQRLQQRVQQRLAALGVDVQPHEGPRTRAQRVRAAFGDDGAALAAALESLEQARYAPGGSPRIDRTWWAAFQAAAQPLRPRAGVPPQEATA
jgi:protein-glutamine gamma-glutamyltransferase